MPKKTKETNNTVENIKDYLLSPIKKDKKNKILPKSKSKKNDVKSSKSVDNPKEKVAVSK